MRTPSDLRGPLRGPTGTDAQGKWGPAPVIYDGTDPSPRPAPWWIDELKVHDRDRRGYVRLKAPNHFLANRKGVVPRHRLVLWEAMGGPDCSPCFWCGYELPWKVEAHRGTVVTEWVVNVDHLNETPGDDRQDNLVPACFWCNVMRGQVDGGLFALLAGELAHIHPVRRPRFVVVLDRLVAQTGWWR